MACLISNEIVLSNMKTAKVFFYTYLLLLFLALDGFAQGSANTPFALAVEQSIEKEQVILVAVDSRDKNSLNIDRILSSVDAKNIIKKHNLICVKIEASWDSRKKGYVIKQNINSNLARAVSSLGIYLYYPKTNATMTVFFSQKNRNPFFESENMIEGFCRRVKEVNQGQVLESTSAQNHKGLGKIYKTQEEAAKDAAEEIDRKKQEEMNRRRAEEIAAQTDAIKERVARQDKEWAAKRAEEDAKAQAENAEKEEAERDAREAAREKRAQDRIKAKEEARKRAEEEAKRHSK